MDNDVVFCALVAFFTVQSLAVAAEFNTYGSSRSTTAPGKHLSVDERVRLSFEYAELANSTGSVRKAKGGVEVRVCSRP